MNTFDYICLSCGERIPVEYKLNGDYTAPGQCPKCQIPVPSDRVAHIVFDFLCPVIPPKIESITNGNKSSPE